MEAFRPDGHLSEEALVRLARNEDVFDGLERLEVSEHLSFCDYCLQRYTETLETAPLLVPQNSCQRSLWNHIRFRSLRLAVSRYTTAAAAVALALTILWGEGAVELARAVPVFPEDRPSISRRLTSWTEELSDSLDQAVFGFSRLFDRFHMNHTAQGGNP